MSTTNKTWDLRQSLWAERTENPIRKIVDSLDEKQANQEKPIIRLTIGDPAVFGNFEPCDFVAEAVTATLKKKGTKFAHNGYAHACGIKEARLAVANKFRYSHNLDENDVVLASGCSGALEIAIKGLANEGDNILIPTPGFSLYQTICVSYGIETRYYNLLPNNNWEADIEHMKSLINEKTRAILVNNPSNPCGSVYSKDHLEQIMAVAEEYCLPIISDEVYANMAWGEKFYSMGELTTNVPVIAVGGIAKQYLVPGWRMGWIITYDPKGYLTSIKQGFQKLATIILGPNTLIQAALPAILNETPESFYQELIQKLEKHAKFSAERLQNVKGLKVIEPKGAMYMLVGIQVDLFDPSSGIVDDVTFSQMLLKEESVFILPGKCFRIPNFFRIVLCPPMEALKDAYDRIEAFCARHMKK